jgi:hypothetical protein
MFRHPHRSEREVSVIAPNGVNAAMWGDPPRHVAVSLGVWPALLAMNAAQFARLCRATSRQDECHRKRNACAY